MKNIIICFLLLSILVGCKKRFNVEKIGWSIELPGSNWKKKTVKEQPKSNENLFKDSDHLIVDEASFEELLVLEKDNSNKFKAALQSYSTPMTEQEYQQMLVDQHNNVPAGYKKKGTPAEFQIGATRIGDKMVDWYDIKLYPADPKEANRIRIYNCMVKDKILFMTISSNNKKDLETLEEIVSSSKFSEKE
jgi:hypothetical protein